MQRHIINIGALAGLLLMAPSATSELGHWLFLKMPQSMRQGCTYKVTIPQGAGSDQQEATVRFDIWNTQSEAIHVEEYNVSHVAQRPSRRAANDARWQTSENLQLVVLAHYVASDRQNRQKLLDAMCALCSLNKF